MKNKERRMKINVARNCLLLLLLCCCWLLNFAQNNDTVAVESIDSTSSYKISKRQYIPKFTATVLDRYEYNTQQNAHHFELCHTRVGEYDDLGSMFSYMASVNLSFGSGYSTAAISHYSECVNVFIGKSVRTGIRLNYEKFFAHAGDLS